MSFKVETVDRFEKEARRLSKKFPSLKGELDQLVGLLETDPFQEGSPLGGNFYKIRLAIQSKGKGKRGGSRVITFVKIVEETVYLVSIYDKSEKSDISKEELNSIISKIFALFVSYGAMFLSPDPLGFGMV